MDKSLRYKLFSGAFCAALIGCAPTVEVAPPPRTAPPAAQLPALPPPQTIVVSPANGSFVCADKDTQLVITAIDQMGRPWISQGAGQGNVPWNTWRMQALNATISNEGMIRTMGNAVSLYGMSVAVRVAPNPYPERIVEASFPITFACPYEVIANGNPGRPGGDGAMGAGGLPGENKPTTGTGAGPGGNGATGGTGSAGVSGERGADGNTLEIDVVLVNMGPTGQPMLQIMIHNRTLGISGGYLLDPVGGSLTIVARGGAGGNGGNGGAGGPGGPAGAGTTDGNGGNGGDGGVGGVGGDGGNGGKITIRADKKVKPYQSVFIFDTAGGIGGMPGRGGPGGAGAPGRAYSNPGNRGKDATTEVAAGAAGASGLEVQWDFVKMKPLW